MAKSLRLKAAQAKAPVRKAIRERIIRKSYTWDSWVGESTFAGWTPAGIHPVAGCRILRVEKDVVIVTDGADGYIPFILSELLALLRQAKSLDISETVRL